MMPVSLPDICSVLAHELRTPLSVLQGYLRLLKTGGRAEGASEGPMLDAMLAATGKLSTIARQASELGQWVQSPPSSPPDPWSLADAMAHRNQGHEINTTALSAAAARPENPNKDDVSELAAAILAAADAAAREAGSARATISLSVDRDGALQIGIRPVTSRLTPAPAAAVPDRGPFFAQGGQGLALVSASFIFDAYRASFTRAKADGSIELSFPLSDGGVAQ